MPPPNMDLPSSTFRWAALIVVSLAMSCGGDVENSTQDQFKATSRPDAPVTKGMGAGGDVQQVSTDRLQATIDPAGQRVDGRFDHLRFAARRTGAGQATASFERIQDLTLVAVVNGPKSGFIEWQGTKLDGFGPLSPDEALVFADIAEHFASERLALIPLDLACQAGADELDPAVGAALLMPWQMLIKYGSSETELKIQAAAAASYCQHLRRPLEAVDPDRIASPSLVALSREQPMPMASGFFPFDREGIAKQRSADG